MVLISQVLSDCRMTELQNSEIIRIEMKDIPAQPVVGSYEEQITDVP